MCVLWQWDNKVNIGGWRGASWKTCLGSQPLDLGSHILRITNSRPRNPEFLSTTRVFPEHTCSINKRILARASKYRIYAQRGVFAGEMSLPMSPRESVAATRLVRRIMHPCPSLDLCRVSVIPAAAAAASAVARRLRYSAKKKKCYIGRQICST